MHVPGFQKNQSNLSFIYISGCISVTKINRVSPENLIKDILFEGITTVIDRLTEPRREHVRDDTGPVSLDAQFSPV